jgi:hypothetical protein
MGKAVETDKCQICGVECTCEEEVDGEASWGHTGNSKKNYPIHPPYPTCEWSREKAMNDFENFVQEQRTFIIIHDLDGILKGNPEYKKYRKEQIEILAKKHNVTANELMNGKVK